MVYGILLIVYIYHHNIYYGLIITNIIIMLSLPQFPLYVGTEYMYPKF